MRRERSRTVCLLYSQHAMLSAKRRVYDELVGSDFENNPKRFRRCLVYLRS